MKLTPLLFASALAVVAFSAPSFAEYKQFTATLTGPSEVPPTDSTGMGKADVAYDAATQEFKWKVTYDGLTGPASAAHFHGPAAEGQNAPPMVKIQKMDSPMDGTANLNKEQEAALIDGKMYINIHSSKFPDGEIRGQLLPAK